MDRLKNLQQQLAYLNEGIVPVGFGEWGVPINMDFNKVLDTLPPDEARKMRRKFRKLWRKRLARAEGSKLHSKLSLIMGLGQASPTKRQKQVRKNEVFCELTIRREKSKKG